MKWIFIVLAFLLINVSCQTNIDKTERNFFIIYGDCFLNDSNINDINVALYRNDTLLTSNKQVGNFEFHLEYNHDYSVIFEKEGYISKTIKVITKEIQEDRWRKGFGRFQFDVELSKQPEKYIQFTGPVGTIKFDPEKDNFGIEVDYETIEKDK